MCREGKANLRDSYAVVRKDAVWLLNCHISQYLPGGPFNHEALRPKKLLLRQAEIDKLAGKTEQKGLTLIPLRITSRGVREVRVGARARQEAVGSPPKRARERGEAGNHRTRCIAIATDNSSRRRRVSDARLRIVRCRPGSNENPAPSDNQGVLFCTFDAKADRSSADFFVAARHEVLD